MQYRTMTIPPEFAGRTAESILKTEFGMSKTRISALKRRAMGVTLNGERIYTTVKVASGDVLRAEAGDLAPVPTAPPVPLPLDIVFEDEWLMVLNKPADLACQPTRDPEEVSVEHGLAAYLGKDTCAHPASRLDKMTSGLMTVAKSGYVHELLKKEMHTELFRKEYRGIATGKVVPAHGFVNEPIGFFEGSSYQRAVRPDGAPSLTEFEVLLQGGGLTLLRLVPHTGRTHQLRLHMAYLGYPLAGDFLYGTEEKELIGRAALHSYELWLRHPVTGEDLHFTASLPEDMRRLVARMEDPAEEG
ncbi:MAG: RluA family pseudouridine synthase [Clostridia bacterium]|nr:RluA family pseudouridine synthase [Clostridia bacterium]